MKYLYISAIIALLTLSVFNYKKQKDTYKYIDECYEKSQKIKNNSNVYFNSLFKPTLANISLNDVVLISDNKTNISKNSLVFFFPPTECKTCIEQNIFEIAIFAKKQNKINVYILTNKNNKAYLKRMARINRGTNIIFGTTETTLPLLNNSYFIVYDNGKISNLFYP